MGGKDFSLIGRPLLRYRVFMFIFVSGSDNFFALIVNTILIL